jgi:aspartate racemase
MQTSERRRGSECGGTPGLLGVLGGMGPLATVDFMHKVLRATEVTRDQDHVPMLVSSIPQIPDRTAAFRGEGVSPLPALVDCGRRLVGAGATLVLMPCNTAHLWFEEVRAALQVPMLHLVDVALEEAVALTGADDCVGLLATDATLASGLYVNRRPAHQRAVRWLLPTAREMNDCVMPGIEAVKAGRLDLSVHLLGLAARGLVQRGASALVLGCTEIPLVLDSGTAGCPVVDATAALARHAAAWSLSERETFSSEFSR